MKFFAKFETFGASRNNKLTQRVNECLRSFNGTLVSTVSFDQFFQLVSQRVECINSEHPRLKPLTLDNYNHLDNYGTASISCEVSGACLRIYIVNQEI